MCKDPTKSIGPWNISVCSKQKCMGVGFFVATKLWCWHMDACIYMGVTES